MMYFIVKFLLIGLPLSIIFAIFAYFYDRPKNQFGGSSLDFVRATVLHHPSSKVLILYHLHPNWTKARTTKNWQPTTALLPTPESVMHAYVITPSGQLYDQNSLKLVQLTEDELNDASLIPPIIIDELSQAYDHLNDATIDPLKLQVWTTSEFNDWQAQFPKKFNKMTVDLLQKSDRLYLQYFK